VWVPKGGTSPNSWNKFKPTFFDVPPAQKFWNELHFPNEYPLAFFEMSFLLPHFLKEGRGKMDVYFTRVFNPVWTYPDGFSWIEALSDEDMMGMHIALTPTWNETAFLPIMSCRWAIRPNGMISIATRHTPVCGSLSASLY
jgi:anaerobic selenocysteine-containing dehydrogenase